MADTDSVWQQEPTLTFSGFTDIYYVYDFNKPKGAFRQDFLFNHNRHNTVNLNLGFIKIAIKHPKYRGNFALQSGTYANDNYAAEPGLLKNIFQANIGLSLNKKNTLWFDAGIMPSHIGFEDAVSVNNMTLTRSLLAENSPYFLTGGKVTFNPNKKWKIVGWIGNGWQRIARVNGNSLLSTGSQLTYSASEKVTLNWSTFVGTDDPDITRRMLYFNNVYGKFKLSEKLKLIAGFDIGARQTAKNSTSYHSWYSPIIIGQYAISNRFKTAIRLEYYSDEFGVIIPLKTTNGFHTTGLSVNIDYMPVKNIVCRLEGRWLNSRYNVFEAPNSLSNNNVIVAASIALQFSEVLKK